MKSSNSREMLQQGMTNSSTNNDPSSQIPLHHHPHHHHLQIHHSSNYDQSSPPNDDFLDQIFSTLPDFSLPNLNDDQHDPQLLSYPQQHLASDPQSSSSLLSAKLRQQQNQVNHGRSPASHEGSRHGESGLIPLPLYLNEAVDASVHGLINGSLHGPGLASIQSQQFHNFQNFGAPANGSNGGGSVQPRQRIRARRGQATDPHSIAERLRRERIAERMKALQELVPNANKTDKASMLDEIIDYLKFLQLQVKVLSMSRLGGAPPVNPIDISSQGGSKCAQPNGVTRNGSASEHQVIKLMEEDMGSAMQYLQGKGLCLMPISLATAISTATSHPRSQLTTSVINCGECPPSPNLSALTVQSTTVGSNGVKDATSISTP